MAKTGEFGEMAKFWRNGEILAKWQNFGEKQQIKIKK